MTNHKNFLSAGTAVPRMPGVGGGAGGRTAAQHPADKDPGEHEECASACPVPARQALPDRASPQPAPRPTRPHRRPPTHPSTPSPLSPVFPSFRFILWL